VAGKNLDELIEGNVFFLFSYGHKQ